ncbi:esterase/lipase family protein [Litorivivens sp.]|uniref:esterase/lipase family protein n=1 Tax=Litorivivens sp. TaxID=2020868 RepID=UPI00356638F9
METGKILHGSARLIFDSVDGVTNIVEGMYRNIAATPLPFGRAPEGSAPGMAGLVHAVVRGVNGGVRGASELALAPLTQYLDRYYPPGPHRAAVVAALNGVCGDHLVRTKNPLAIPMSLRLLLDPIGDSEASEPEPTPSMINNLFDSRRQSVEIYPHNAVQGDPRFKASSRLLILAHGLCMNDLEWTAHQRNHGLDIADSGGYTPVFLRYNSGRHISDNGKAFARQISGLVTSWPVPVESITVIGFSMGGLITRSALHVASDEKLPWLKKVDKVVYVGTPHHGSSLERGGYWLQRSATFSPYTEPLSALGRIRSDGITDLRHGNILDADWQNHDEHEDNADYRQLVPLPDAIEHYAIAATLSKQPVASMEKLRSDGLVHPCSGLGKHRQAEKQLNFAQANTHILYDVGHLAMLGDPRVTLQLQRWLVG